MGATVRDTGCWIVFVGARVLLLTDGLGPVAAVTGGWTVGCDSTINFIRA
jgi:hypothetical protein